MKNILLINTLVFAFVASVFADGHAAEIKALQNQIDALASAVEGGSSSNGWWDKTSVGGYGELHYNNTESSDKLDFHRFVLFVNHDFTDKISLFTELELEHSLAGESFPGEVELEQAFVRFDLDNGLSADLGLFLMPIGILNETHEPDTFYGVERNAVEKYIIPTTWWQGGAKVTKDLGNGVTVDFAVTDGLNTTDGYIRGARQKVANAVANDGAYTLRAVYNGIAGLQLGATMFKQDDLSQGDGDQDATLTVLHAVYKKGGFGLKALTGEWDIDSTDAGIAKQDGFYIEPSYEFDTAYGKVGVFYRVAEYNYYKSGAQEKEDTTYGVNYWPTDNVVLKGDITESNGSETLSLGVGYQF